MMPSLWAIDVSFCLFPVAQLIQDLVQALPALLQRFEALFFPVHNLRLGLAAKVTIGQEGRHPVQVAQAFLPVIAQALRLGRQVYNAFQRKPDDQGTHHQGDTPGRGGLRSAVGQDAQRLHPGQGL